MKPEELVEFLKGNGLGEEEIEVLLAEAIKVIHPEEQPHDEVVAEQPDEISDDEIAKRFGI